MSPTKTGAKAPSTKKAAAAAEDNQEKTKSGQGPLAATRAAHGTKEKLVDTVMSLLDHVAKSEEGKDDVKARFLALSNKKLLRLHNVASELREKFGTAEKAAESLAQLVGRAKDAPYLTKLKTFSPSKLLDLLHVAQKRDARAKAAQA